MKGSSIFLGLMLVKYLIPQCRRTLGEVLKNSLLQHEDTMNLLDEGCVKLSFVSNGKGLYIGSGKSGSPYYVLNNLMGSSDPYLK